MHVFPFTCRYLQDRTHSLDVHKLLHIKESIENKNMKTLTFYLYPKSSPNYPHINVKIVNISWPELCSLHLIVTAVFVISVLFLTLYSCTFISTWNFLSHLHPFPWCVKDYVSIMIDFQIFLLCFQDNCTCPDLFLLPSHCPYSNIASSKQQTQCLLYKSEHIQCVILGVQYTPFVCSTNKGRKQFELVFVVRL